MKRNIFLYIILSLFTITTATKCDGGSNNELCGQSRLFQDPPSFHPYMNYFPVAEGTVVKGAVVCAGDAFQFRSDQMEGNPVAPVTVIRLLW